MTAAIEAIIKISLVLFLFLGICLSPYFFSWVGREYNRRKSERSTLPTEEELLFDAEGTKLRLDLYMLETMAKMKDEAHFHHPPDFTDPQVKTGGKAKDKVMWDVEYRDL